MPIFATGATLVLDRERAAHRLLKRYGKQTRNDVGNAPGEFGTKSLTGRSG
jgi:hypothetical protein